MTSSLTNVKTLTQFLHTHIEDERLCSDMIRIYSQICLATKVTANAVRRAALEHLLGEAGVQNIQGEDVKKLDLLANQAFTNCMVDSGRICAMASEEDADMVVVPQDQAGDYTIAFDPLDGSSNIDANVSIGSIFGIWRRVTPSGSPATLQDVLQSGKEMISGGYSLYGASTMVVFSVGDGVHGFTLDNSLGEFILTHPSMQVKPEGSIYSINEGNSLFWDKSTTEFVRRLKAGEAPRTKPCSLRYIGSMVADVHRTLLYGGVFMYPSDAKSPNGKLRYLYEVAPLSMLMEQAGGKAVTGAVRALDVAPGEMHMRVPCFMGSSREVDELQGLYLANK